MNKILTRMVAALALGSALAVSVPAEARDWRGDRGWHRGDDGRGWRGDRQWRGDRYWRGDRHWRGDRWGRGYGYAPRGYYAPRYGYGYGYPRYRGYYRDRGGDDALIGAIAGLAIGAAIASSD
jgi:hypothetical protein